MKQVAGMELTTGSDNLCSRLHLDNVENMRCPDIGSLINSGFLEPMNSFNPFSTRTYLANSSFLELNELGVFYLL